MSLLRPHLEAIAGGDADQRAAARRILSAYVRDEIQSRLAAAHPGSACDDAALESAAGVLAAELREWPPESRDAIADAVRTPAVASCGRDHALDFLARFASAIPWWKRV